MKLQSRFAGFFHCCAVVTVTVFLIGAMNWNQNDLKRPPTETNSLLFQSVCLSNVSGIPKRCAQYALNVYSSMERERERKSILKTGEHQIDKVYASRNPFITGNGFRNMCYPYVIDDTDNCKLDSQLLRQLPDGHCVYVVADCFPKFASEGVKYIQQRFSVVVHNGDQSVPDGQADHPGHRVSAYVAYPQMSALHISGKLLALHAKNLWWREHKTTPRPAWLHCLPSGLENRRWPTGNNMTGYVSLFNELVVNSRAEFQDEDRPLALVRLNQKQSTPDKARALSHFQAMNFTIIDGLSHEDWVRAIHHYRFTICPFGHGLDTYRLWEVLLMGGIPVVKNSSIVSCIDDSDNLVRVIRGTGEAYVVRRGSLPIVVVKEWSDVTAELLESYWAKFTSGSMVFDYSRVFLPSWQARILGH